MQTSAVRSGCAFQRQSSQCERRPNRRSRRSLRQAAYKTRSRTLRKRAWPGDSSGALSSEPTEHSTTGCSAETGNVAKGGLGPAPELPPRALLGGGSSGPGSGGSTCPTGKPGLGVNSIACCGPEPKTASVGDAASAAAAKGAAVSWDCSSEKLAGVAPQLRPCASFPGVLLQNAR